jgi:hypothetical protein
LAADAGLPDFLGTTYQNYQKLPQNIPNGHKIYQAAVKCYKTHHNLPLQIVLKKLFLSENKPSGNPEPIWKIHVQDSEPDRF